MKYLLCVFALYLSNAAFADSKGGVVYYDFDDGSGSLLIKGDVAESMYADLAVRGTREVLDVDVTVIAKRGKNLNCYKRSDTEEVQCVISVKDRQAGSIE